MVFGKSWTRFALLAAGAAATLVPAISAEGAASRPFPCDGEVYIAQGLQDQFKFYRANQADEPIVLEPITAPKLAGFNAISFNREDGLIYGTTYKGEVVKIDADGNFSSLGIPTGIPAKFQNSGEITLDGLTYYRWASNEADSLVKIDLTARPLVGVPVPIKSLGVPAAADIALNPKDGKFYGVDNQGQLLAVDIVNDVATRTKVPGLPSKTTFGAVWFDAAGTFFAFDNAGQVYAIDPVSQSIKYSTDGPSSPRNDGTACVNSVVGIAKNMTADNPSVPATVTITLTVENFKAQTLTNVRVTDDLENAFGEANTWRVVGIKQASGPSTLEINADYDGRDSQELLLPGSTLPPSTTASIAVTVAISAPGTYENQARVAATGPGGNYFGDLSTAGTNPDPNGDGAPSERDLSTLTLTAGVPPILAPDEATTDFETPVVLDVLANDRPGPGGRPIVPSSVQIKDPADGVFRQQVSIVGEGDYTVDPKTGAITFTPEAGFSGAATAMTYRAADAGGNSDTTTFAVTVNPASTPPTVDPGTDPLPEVLGVKFAAPEDTEVLGTSFDSLAATGGIAWTPLFFGVGLLGFGSIVLLVRRLVSRRNPS